MISEPKVVNGATKVRREWVKEAIAATMVSIVRWKEGGEPRTRGGNHPAVGCDFSSKEVNELGKDVNLS